MTTLALPPARPPRVPSVQLAWHHVALVARLAWIWLEAAPGLGWLLAVPWWFGSRAFALRWLLVAGAVVALYTWRAWHKGKFGQNVANTYEAIVAWDWRKTRLTHWTLPKLVSVKVAQPYTVRQAIQRHRQEGNWGIPAAAARIELRPHAVDLPTEAWAYQLEWFVTSRWCFSHWEQLQPSKRSPHVLVLDMGELVIPDAVTAGEWSL